MNRGFEFIADPELRNEMFGEVKVTPLPNGNRQVELVIMPGDDYGQSFSMAALALDGSRSMLKEFGRHLPPILQEKFNKVQPFARELGQFLARNHSGKTALAYWGCGDGRDVEPVGLLTEELFANQKIAGPKQLGCDTYLLPIIRYFWEEVFSQTDQSKPGVVVVLSDGMWSDDLETELLPFTQSMCEQIAAGRRALMKIVMLLYETECNRSELLQCQNSLDSINDFNSKTEIDIWDVKWLNYLTSYEQLFLNLTKVDTLSVGGKVVDNLGHVLLEKKAFEFGIQFELPKEATGFTLHLDGVGEYSQQVPL